jgi:predicted 3-demethylubiquinone-9 3-methyltransferase (glyoxalase superfamily)
LTANFLRNPCRYELTTSKGHMNVAVYTTALSTSRAACKSCCRLRSTQRPVCRERARKTTSATVQKKSLCLWYHHDAEAATQFYARTFLNSAAGAVHRAPSDFPDGKVGNVLPVEFTVYGVPYLGLNGGDRFKHSEAFSFQIATDDQAETNRYWNAIVDNGGTVSDCGWCKARRGFLPEAMVMGGGVAKRAFESMMEMEKIDVAKIGASMRRCVKVPHRRRSSTVVAICRKNVVILVNVNLTIPAG